MRQRRRDDQRPRPATCPPRNASRPVVRLTTSRTPRLFEGQGTHVGAHYDMYEDGTEWRVMVIGMETGRADEHVSNAARTVDQDDAIRMTFNQRHAHMRGTTSALRVAFGGEFGGDRAGELLDLGEQREAVHVMNAYALVNMRLCSATKGGSFRSAANSTMTNNCFPHLVRTVEILEPTLCILQGMGAYKDVAHCMRVIEELTPNLAAVQFGTHRTMFFRGNHPSAARSTTGYGTVSPSEYFRRIVEPSILEARRLWFE